LKGLILLKNDYFGAEEAAGFGWGFLDPRKGILNNP
jgi:hypothetical protein